MNWQEFNKNPILESLSHAQNSVHHSELSRTKTACAACAAAICVWLRAIGRLESYRTGKSWKEGASRATQRSHGGKTHSNGIIESSGISGVAFHKNNH